jgi:hypothetical protein
MRSVLECLQKTIVQWWKCTNQTIELGHFMLFSFFIGQDVFIIYTQWPYHSCNNDNGYCMVNWS